MSIMAKDNPQLAFSFDAPPLAQNEADLAGLDRMVSAAVSLILKNDSRDRHIIAAEMTSLLAEDVSYGMLNAYASEARDGHNISAHRLFALIAVTKRFDALDKLLRKIGVTLLVGEEIHTAQLGHIQQEIAELKKREKELKSIAKPFGSMEK